MYFEQGHIYPIYNQGNNRQRIFFESENYLFFLKKMREYLLPYCDIIAYCLMPNHFHWMVEVKEVTQSSEGFAPSETLTIGTTGTRTLNDSIGVMLRSYTRAINKQQNRSGSLFREATKAECLTKPESITPSFYITRYATMINTHQPELEYPQICFDYIHQNPVKVGLVKNAVDWEFSSCRDYIGLRNGTLINKNVATKANILFAE